jgi:hypothetical protein
MTDDRLVVRANFGGAAGEGGCGDGEHVAHRTVPT